MAIYCMDERGEETPSICQDNAELIRRKDTADGFANLFRCTICNREWKEIYTYEGMCDMAGNPV